MVDEGEMGGRGGGYRRGFFQIRRRGAHADHVTS